MQGIWAQINQNHQSQNSINSKAQSSKIGTYIALDTLNDMQENGQGQKRSKIQTFSYQAHKIVGNGTFGVVYRATVTETGDTVAVKKVFQDKKYKNRELAILKELDHPNIIRMKHAFITQGDKKEEVYLNIVMDFMPETVYRVHRHYRRLYQRVPDLLIQLYFYQLLRGLGYMQSLGIVHRDIKPQNLLVDPICQVLKICDFGSAKKLTGNEPNVSYICSRYYRAPELIFGNTNYSTQVDVWSAACVIGELVTGDILFKGEMPHSQLVEIIKKLGTPTEAQIKAMNPNYKDFKFPIVKQQPFKKFLGEQTDPLLLDLLSKLLVYDPKERLSPYEALAHEYFQPLREKPTKLPNGNAIVDLFNFSDSEKIAMGDEIITKLTPEWYISNINGFMSSSDRQTSNVK